MRKKEGKVNLMADKVTCSRNMFRVEDITHYPTRFQSEVNDDFCDCHNCGDNVVRGIYPQKPVTIEAAIAFFEKYADGEKSVLYKQTASWLKSVLRAKDRRNKDES